MDVAGRVVLITGASSGVGAALAEQLAGMGARVVVNYSRSADAADAVVSRITSAGGQALAVQADVSEETDCKQLVAATIEQFGQLDALVNNAGTTKFVDHDKLEGLSAEDFQRIYSVNVVGAYQMTRAVSPFMQGQEEGGAVVNVASTAGITGIGSCVAYAASKGAMVTMTLSLARALGPKLRINAVCPGFIEGDWLKEGYGDARYAKLMAFNRDNAPLGVTATPETVADAILHFISGPQVVTGETLIVDGGRHLTMAPLSRR